MDASNNVVDPCRRSQSMWPPAIEACFDHIRDMPSHAGMARNISLSLVDFQLPTSGNSRSASPLSAAVGQVSEFVMSHVRMRISERVGDAGLAQWRLVAAVQL